MIPVDQRGFLAGLGGGFFRPLIADPFPWRDFDCATNGLAMVLLNGATLPERECPDLAAHVDLERPNAREVSFHALRAWAVKAGSLFPTCPYCQSPADFPNLVPCTLGDIDFNRALLAHYLRQLVAERVTVSWASPTDALLVASADWRVYIMPLARNSETRFDLDASAVPPEAEAVSRG